MNLKIKTTNFDAHTGPSVNEETVQVDGKDLLSCIATYVGMEGGKEALKERIRTESWFAGVYKWKGKNVIWETDVAEVEYSISKFNVPLPAQYTLQFTTKFNRYGEEFRSRAVPTLMEDLYDDIECWFATPEEAEAALENFHFQPEDAPKRIEIVKRELTVVKSLKFKV